MAHEEHAETISTNDPQPRVALLDPEVVAAEDETVGVPAQERGLGKMEGLPIRSNPQIEAAVSTILGEIGEDPEREGLINTPKRVARMYDELTAGYRVDPESLLNDAIFTVEYDEMVVVRDIHFYSLCEHHMLPFHGRVHVAYLPNGKVIGLSKIPRIVELYARRLQVQERMTVEIAAFIDGHLHPHGVGVVVEGVHMCSVMRGVRKENASMVTSAMRGSFKHDSKTRNEFLALIRGGERRA
jgi:GTP cyclohydrolase I